jgi:zinc transport system substrate-binding protein
MALRFLAAALVGLGFVVAVGGRPAAADAPAVVVSIKPIHALVAGVMAGVAEPQLLIRGAASPHSYALRPSQGQALARADLVFWMGEGLEQFLVKPLSALAADAKVVALRSSAGLRTLATRNGGLWADDQEDHQGETGQVDMHLWLDPRNAAAMVATIAATLSAIDPERAALYQANAADLDADLARLDADLAARLAPVRDRPFVVFHDGYHYLEDRYGLNAVGSISVDPLRRPGAGRLREIRARLAAREVDCVFAEPQFRPALVETVVAGTGARTGVLDPLGAGLEAGPGHYALLMETLSQSLVACLDPSRSG